MNKGQVSLAVSTQPPPLAAPYSALPQLELLRAPCMELAWWKRRVEIGDQKAASKIGRGASVVEFDCDDHFLTSCQSSTTCPSPPMGLCLSSCRRRRRRRHSNGSLRPHYQYSEESPLLGDPNVDDSQSTGNAIVNVVNKAVEIIAALKNGKYPSQDQVDSLLRWFLQSDILRESRYTRISEQGQRIIHDVHHLCSVLLIFSVEKNGTFLFLLLNDLFHYD